MVFWRAPNSNIKFYEDTLESFASNKKINLSWFLRKSKNFFCYSWNRNPLSQDSDSLRDLVNNLTNLALAITEDHNQNEPDAPQANQPTDNQGHKNGSRS